MTAATAFAVTLLIEVPLLLAAWWALGWTHRRWGRAVAVAFVVNLTNPILWWLRPGSWAVLIVAEVAVVGIEGCVAAALLRRPRRDVPTALVVALVSNSASFLAGLVWQLAAG